MFQVGKDRTLYFDQNGQIMGMLTYPKEASGVVNINYIFVDPSLRGRKIASQLLEHAFSYLVLKNEKIICSCPYVKHWLQKHPEYQPFVEE